MLTLFPRSFSLPRPNSLSSSKDKTYHVRSTSLPCRSLPLLSQLDHHINSLRAWQSQPSNLTQLELLLHLTLHDLLPLPHTRRALRRHRHSQTLLDDFLRLADAFGSFRDVVLALQRLVLDAEVAVRRRDKSKLASYAKTWKKTMKEVVRLVGVVRGTAKSQDMVARSAGDLELVRVLREVKVVAAEVAVSVFLRVMGMSLEPFKAAPTGWLGLRKRVVAAAAKEEEWRRSLEELKELGRIMVKLESGSGRVFRCLVNTRVTLLNILN